MSNCYQPDCNSDIPVPTPTPLPPCEDGEACKEVVDANCVVYTGEELLPVGVETNDRLDDIIRKWSEATEAGTQAISTQQTLTTAPTGSGLGTNPLRLDVRVSAYPNNLLKVVDYTDEFSVHRTGLQVVLDAAAIGSILTQISQSEELRTLFCEVVELCSANSCKIATNLTVSTDDDS
jgi:hypothetical protein